MTLLSACPPAQPLWETKSPQANQRSYSQRSRSHPCQPEMFTEKYIQDRLNAVKLLPGHSQSHTGTAGYQTGTGVYPHHAKWTCIAGIHTNLLPPPHHHIQMEGLPPGLPGHRHWSSG